MEKNYTAPAVTKTAFHCPHCGTKAPQQWMKCFAHPVENNIPVLTTILSIQQLISRAHKDGILPPGVQQAWFKEGQASEAGDFLFKKLNEGDYVRFVLENIFFSVCEEASCGKAALWIHDKLIIPSNDISHEPNEDMPDAVKAIYNEAREVHKSSPRAAAALLRLCCELVCEYLVAQGKDLNAKIGDLVSRGLDTSIQQALDYVRVVGNDAVHPGQITQKDNNETAEALFILLNEIVAEMISKPKQMESLYSKLPEAIRDSIAKRDKQTKQA